MKNHILFVDGMSHLLIYLEEVNFIIIRYTMSNVNEIKIFADKKQNTYKFFKNTRKKSQAKTDRRRIKRDSNTICVSCTI
jgi:hypothetical protein